MSRLSITPRKTPFRLTMTVPGDKSISHRAVMFGAIAKGRTEIDGFLPGQDCLSTIQCFRKLGVEIEQIHDTKVVVHGKGFAGLQEPIFPLDVGNSGTTLRLILGILAGRPFFSTVYGDSSIARRPMKRVVDPLRQMGAKIFGRDGGNFAPLAVQGGKLKGISYQSPIASAQVKSCLLLAGLQAEGETSVTEPMLSRDHTERMLPAFGVELKREGRKVSVPGGQSLAGTQVTVPGDFSSAAFFLSAALLIPGSEVTVERVGINPTRTGLLEAFQRMGAKVEVEHTGEWCGEPVGNVRVSRDRLAGISIGGELIPRMIDEIPIFALVATQAEGITVIRDAAELKVKESNRIHAIATELRRLGAKIEETDDGLIIEGPTPLTGGTCFSHGDHRIGMTLAIAGLASSSQVIVEGAQVISISFPGFPEQIQEVVGSCY
jgi:3-phosphoshikimate 1-carboxyvinyltransferase